MRKPNKKGFTIVELVIVIAVVAILAAVLIPTFVNVVNKANVSNDTALVRNINTVLATEEIMDGKPATMSDALKMAERGGFDVSKLTPRSSGDIVWDEDTNRFALINGNDTVFSENDKKINPSSKVWKFADNASAAENESVYSVYLKDGVTGAIEVSTGIDVGNNTVSSLTYNGGDSAKDVTIRTSSFNTSLNINAPKDTVKHYGNANSVSITAVADASYDEFGHSNVIEIKDGHVVLTESAVVEKIVVASSETTDKVSVEAFISVQLTVKDENVKTDNLSVETKQDGTIFVADNALNGKVSGKVEEVNEVNSVESFKNVFATGGFIKLTGDITGTEGVSFVVAEGKVVYIDLNGHNITNAVIKKPAIVNNGKLTFTGTGTVVNGNDDKGDSDKANGSHVIENSSTGYLHIISGTFGSDTNVGNAIRNVGNCVIDGGSFSAIKNGTGKGYAYVFANGAVTDDGQVIGTGVMVINNATALDIEANGMFAADAGEIIINGGNYSLTGANSYYMFYIVSKDTTKLTVNGGTFTRSGAERFFGFSELNNTQGSNDMYISVAEKYNIFIRGGRLTNGAEVLFSK